MIRSFLLALSVTAAAPLAAQVLYDPMPEQGAQTPAQPMQTIQQLPSGDAELAKAAAARGDAPEALSRYLRVLATHPDDADALAGAGQAALAVGDLNAASGFFGRAEARAPNNGAVKAGIASMLARQGDFRGSLKYFKAAAGLGVPEASLAADRGLAYDLSGANRRAQAEYQMALRAHPDDAGLIKRLALSLALSGDGYGAMATLDPLLRKQDTSAWRTRMFARALAGDVSGANADAALVLNAQQAAMLAPYLAKLPSLKPTEKAAVVFLGRFPAASRPATVASAPVYAQNGPAARAFADVPLPPLAADDSGSTLPLIEFGRGRPAPTVASATPPIATPPAAASRTPAPRVVAPAAVAPTAAPPVVRPPVSPPAPTRAERLAQARADAAEKAKRDKADKAAEDAKAAKLAARNPKRYWAQVAGGANKADLPKAWAKLKAAHSADLAGRSPWTMPFRFTNRLLVGPFATSAAAQSWVNEKRAKGLATFMVTTDAGTQVEQLD